MLDCPIISFSFNYTCYVFYMIYIVVSFHCYYLILFCSFVFLIIYALYVTGMIILMKMKVETFTSEVFFLNTYLIFKEILCGWAYECFI